MKRIAQLLVVSLLAVSAQAAWSQQTPERYHGQALMEALGITGNTGPFPARGGPIDD